MAYGGGGKVIGLFRIFMIAAEKGRKQRVFATQHEHMLLFDRGFDRGKIDIFKVEKNFMNLNCIPPRRFRLHSLIQILS